MNTDVEDLLREGMERFTADLRAPAGMARRAAGRRRRRLALRSGAAAAAALTAGVVVLAAAGVPGTGHDGIDTTAYVVTRVDGALSVAGPGQIAQMTVTTTGSAPAPGGTAATTTAEEWSYGSQWRSVTYTPAGHPVYDEGFNSASVYTLVSYQTRTWARQPGLGRPAAPASLAPGPFRCGPVIAALPLLFQPGLPAFQPRGPDIGFPASSGPATVATAVRKAIACGTLAVAGRQRVDGIEAIELTSRPNSLISEIIWVSPGTYLPVRVVVRFPPGLPGSQQTVNITWLPPTAQNLAQLTVPIPAGFRQVPLAQALKPILRQFPGGLLPRFPAGPLPVVFGLGPKSTGW